MPSRALRAFSAAAGIAVLLAPIAPAALAETPDPGVHVVRDGETLWQIAFDAGMDPAAVAALNGLTDQDVIVVGQSLKLPAASPAASAKPVPARSKVTVTPGDTLWSISEQYDVTVDDLVAANALDDPNQLVAGTELVIPGGVRPTSQAAAQVAAPASAPAPASPPQDGGKSIVVPYTVQPGESVIGVARHFGVTADAIVAANGLQDANQIRAGSVLKVPVPSRQHTVQDGENLYAIAAQEKVDLGTLVDFNEIPDPSLIRIGQVLLIPAPRTPAVSTATPPPAPPPAPAPAADPTPAPSPATPAPAPDPTPKPAVTAPAIAAADGIAGAARKLVGLSYRWGGSDPSGFDCSGLVWYVAKQVGKPLPRGLQGQFNAGSHPSKDALQPGDIVFFQNTYMPGLSHNGVYVGNGQFVHAADEQSGVTISSMSAAYWATRYFGATRVP